MKLMTMAIRLVVVGFLAVAGVECGAKDNQDTYWDSGVLKNRNFTPTPEQIAAREETRSAVINLFDSLPQIPETEMESVASKQLAGKHHFTLDGMYQAYDTRLETVLYSNTEPESVCKAYQKYVNGLGDEWMKSKKTSDEVYCKYDNKTKVRGFYIAKKRSAKDEASFFSQITIKNGPIRPVNGKMWKTAITFTADYTLNSKARGHCMPEAMVPDEFPCNSSQWHEPMAR